MTRDELKRLWEDPANWTILGYRCDDDPRLIVPKRTLGIGWTVNLAHPLAWPLIVVVVAAVGGLLLYRRGR